jgi:hypothetical protein
MNRQVLYMASVENERLIAGDFEKPIEVPLDSYVVLGKVSGRYFNAHQIVVQRNEEEIVAWIREKFPEANLVAFKYSRFPPRSNQFTPEVGLAVKINSPEVLELMSSGSGRKVR